MTRFAPLILIALCLGCYPESVPVAVPDGSPMRSLSAPLSTSTTPTGLQTVLRSATQYKPTTFTGTITLAKPLEISQDWTDLSGGTLVYNGTECAIKFIGTHDMKGVSLHDLTIIAPNSDAMRWQVSGNIHFPKFRNLVIVAGGARLNLDVQGDGNCYFPQIENVVCESPDNGTSGPALQGCIRGGTVEGLVCVNNHFRAGTSAMIVLHGDLTGMHVGSHVTFSGRNWLEGNIPVLNSTGPFAYIRWLGNWPEPHGQGPQWFIDGDQSTLLCDSIGLSANQPARLSNGAGIQYLARPGLMAPDGTNPPLSLPLDYWDPIAKTFPLLDRLRSDFIFDDANSMVQFGGGTVSKAGAKVTTIRPATQAVEPQQ